VRKNGENGKNGSYAALTPSGWWVVFGGWGWRLGGAAVPHCPTGPLSLLLWCCHAVLATLLRMSAKSFRLSARLSASFF